MLPTCILLVAWLSRRMSFEYPYQVWWFAFITIARVAKVFPFLTSKRPVLRLDWIYLRILSLTCKNLALCEFFRRYKQRSSWLSLKVKMLSIMYSIWSEVSSFFRTRSVSSSGFYMPPRKKRIHFSRKLNGSNSSLMSSWETFWKKNSRRVPLNVLWRSTPSWTMRMYILAAFRVVLGALFSKYGI